MSANLKTLEDDADTSAMYSKDRFEGDIAMDVCFIITFITIIIVIAV